jgi:hypothetical protein
MRGSRKGTTLSAFSRMTRSHWPLIGQTRRDGSCCLATCRPATARSSCLRRRLTRMSSLAASCRMNEEQCRRADYVSGKQRGRLMLPAQDKE